MDEVTSVHEPDKYIREGLLHIVPGNSFDNDDMQDLVILCQKFPDINVEVLTYIKKDGSIYKFIDKH